jgi:hydroxypyruvate reductase
MDEIPQNLSLYQGSHPIPDLNSLKSAEKILEQLDSSTIHDLFIFLISGGGSSLLTALVRNISLEDLRNLTSLLLECGASIDEINCIRKHLSRVKGGGLARLSHPAPAATLILSDVVGDPLDVIASGPTVPDPTTYADAIQILQHYDILHKIPASICGHLRKGAKGEIPETPKDGDPIFKNIQNIIVGNNLQAAQAGIRQAKREGFNSLLLTTQLQGEAKEGGSILASIARQISLTGDPVKKPACILCGGETTVKIKGEGFGGRNQEFVLGAVKGLSGSSNTMIISLATDGDDGPTDAAGAVATGKTLERAWELGLNLDDSLSRNDSYNFFEPLGDLIKTGQTETNVCDLSFIFVL